MQIPISDVEQEYTLDGDGTTCLIYSGDTIMYECRISGSSSGFVVSPEVAVHVTLVAKGGGEFMYIENEDLRPLTVVDDSTIIIQRNGRRYRYVRSDYLYDEWADDIVDIVHREVEQWGRAHEGHNYVLSARERQQAGFIQWLVAGMVLTGSVMVSYYVVSTRRRRQIQLQLQQIREVAENRPQAVRQVAQTVEDSFFDSDEYVLMRRRIESGDMLTADDWIRVHELLRTVYPGFTTQLRSLYPMSELEFQTCMLVKLRIAPTDIAAVLARDVSTISTVRSRLYGKVFGRKGGAREWDEFILSMGV